MDAFEDGNFEQSEVDPAAEFLAREQNALAGLEDEIPLAQPAAAVSGGASSGLDSDVTQPKADFEMTGSFELINNSEPGLVDFDGALVTNGDGQDFDQDVGRSIRLSPLVTNEEDGNDDFSGYTVPKPLTEEPEKIRKWREEQKARLEEKDAEEERKKLELREQARKELEDWYKHHEEAISKTKAANRNAEKQFVAETDEIEPGTEWERIAKLCDFNPKTNKSSKDISRMRSIVLQLKQNPIATSKKA